MSDQAFEALQRSYDNMTPPEDGPDAGDKAQEFLALVAGDLFATSDLGSYVWDYEAPRVSGFPRPQRQQQAWEVLFDAMDYRDFHREAMELLVKAAAGENIQTRVADLLNRVAENWADMNAED